MMTVGGVRMLPKPAAGGYTTVTRGSALLSFHHGTNHDHPPPTHALSSMVKGANPRSEQILWFSNLCGHNLCTFALLVLAINLAEELVYYTWF